MCFLATDMLPESYSVADCSSDSEIAFRVAEAVKKLEIYKMHT